MPKVNTDLSGNWNMKVEEAFRKPKNVKRAAMKVPEAIDPFIF